MTRKRDLEKYLKLLREYYFKHKLIPNFEVVKDIFWLKSKGSITRIFQELVNLNYLIKDWDKYFPADKLTSIQMYESVQAWFPAPWREDSKTELNLQEFLIQNPNSTFLLKVKGDSMKDAGIFEWDIVIVDKSKKAKLGEIVVWLIDWEYTLKYYQKDDKGKYCLVPANNNYPTLYPSEELQIFWIVTSIIRKLV